MVQAEIVTVGDEILIGQIVDTNAAEISRRLNSVGITVSGRLTVGDTLSAISDALSRALESVQVVIVTGGLGPTRDDVTKTAAAGLFSCGLVQNTEQLELNRDRLKARGIEFNSLNVRQSEVPERCTVLLNRHGTAPGMWFDTGRSVLVLLPGVPSEMRMLMDEEVIPRLAGRFSLRSVVHRTLNTFGIAESVLAERISSWEDALPDWLHLAYLPSASGVRLRLSAYDVDGSEAAEEIGRRFDALAGIISGHILGFEDEDVFHAVSSMLLSRGETVSAAESCTGGRIAASFTAIPGASAVFSGGVVSYTDHVKESVLGVDSDVLERCGAVSREVAVMMAEGARKACGSTYALSTTGVAGPTGGDAENPVGTVWMALAAPKGTFTCRVCAGDIRSQVIERASTMAADMLRRYLLGSDMRS